MIRIIHVLLFLFPLLATAQTVDIESCYRKARQNYPLVKQYDLIGASEKYSLQNASRVYIPQLALNAGATYQTQVLEFPFSIPGIEIPEFSKDQYSAYLELTQIIWDGGAVSAQRKNIKAQAEVSREQYEVDMYALRQRVNELYFSLLLLREQIKQADIYLDDLKTTLEKVQSCVLNGVANKADEDVVKVEQLSAQQRKVTLESACVAFLKMLSLLTGEEILSAESLAMPPMYSDTELLLSGNLRPELSLFDAKSQELLSQKHFITAKNLPHLGLFIRGAYGRPGLNYLNNDFSGYAIGGVKLTWNFGGLYTIKNEKRLIETGVRQVDLQREAFLFNTDIALAQQSAEVQKYRKIMEDDDNIISLRHSIRTATETQMGSGTKNASDLMRDINREQISRQEKILHEIQCLKSIYEIKNTKNQ